MNMETLRRSFNSFFTRLRGWWEEARLVDERLADPFADLDEADRRQMDLSDHRPSGEVGSL
jgi:hypothetical protein